MQSDTPQGDPRLQRTIPGPPGAVGIVDPCIVFLEATLPGEIPLLVTCVARSSQEFKLPGEKSRCELSGVLILQNNAFAANATRQLWRIHSRREKTVYLVTSASGKHAKCSYLSEGFADAPAPAFRWSIRFLDPRTYQALLRFKDMTCLARFIYLDSNLDWQSARDFIAATRNRSRQPLIRRFLSSIFKKNHTAVPA
jgi:hypothetical protein